MIVVSDASPLIALARVNRVDLLRSVFGRLIIPEAVWKEVALSGADKAGSNDFACSSSHNDLCVHETHDLTIFEMTPRF